METINLTKKRKRMDQGTEGINSKKAEVIDSLCQRASEYPERDQGKSFM